MAHEPTQDQPGNQPEPTPPSDGVIDAAASQKKDDDILSTGLARLGYSLGDELPVDPPATEPPETPAETPEVPETPAATEPAAPAETPAETPAEPPPEPEPERRPKRKVKPPQPSVDEIVNRAVDRIKQATVPPATPPAPPPVDDLASLSDVDREEVELARFAAKAMPGKYGDMERKIRDFVDSRNKKVAEIIRENGEFDPNDEEYRKWVGSVRPNYSGADRNKLITERIKHETEESFERKYAEREKKLQREIKKVEAAPVIASAARETYQEIVGIDDDVAKAVAADPAKAIENNPFEAPTVLKNAQDTTKMVEEYMRISSGIIDADAQNPIHVGLDHLIAAQGRKLDAMPQDKRVAPDGRVWVSRDAYFKMREANDPNLSSYRTFEDRDVVTLIREFGKSVTVRQLSDIREKLAKSGYKREPSAAAPSGAPKAVVPPVAPAAPKKPTAPKAASPASSPSIGAPGEASPAWMKSLGYSG